MNHNLATLVASGLFLVAMSGCVSDAPANPNATSGASGSIGNYPDEYLLSSYPMQGDWELARQEYAYPFGFEGGNPGEGNPEDFCLGENNEDPCPEEAFGALFTIGGNDVTGISMASRFAAGELTDMDVRMFCNEVDDYGIVAQHGTVLIYAAADEAAQHMNDWDAMVANLLASTGAKLAC